MGRKGLTSAPAFLILILTAILLSSGSAASQDEKVLFESDEIGTEVLLNHPDVNFDPDPLMELWEDGYVNIPGAEPPLDTYWFSKGPFLYLSHYNPDLGVEIKWENLTSLLDDSGIKDHPLEGYSISIMIPCTPDFENYQPGESLKYSSDVDIDPGSIDWQKAMKEELDWLQEIDVISGLGEPDIEAISSLSDHGNMGPNHRVIFHHNTTSWELYEDTGLPYLTLLFGESTPMTRSEFPDSTAPTPQKNGEGGALGLISIIAATLAALFILGSLFYYRANRALKINNARRKLIYETIREDPGIHFRKLMKELDLKPGVASYHLNKLEKEEHIKSFQDGMYRRFYPFEEKVEMKVMLSDMQALIIDVIKE
ncbi:MAG: winged helix-turn-helix transcriptional regulator, partial [Thermoplasmatota archaeon]